MILAPDSCACPIQEVGPSMAASCGSQMLLFMSLLEGFINGRCDLADPCRRVRGRDTLDESYDFVVVGAGAAGPVVAARLSENPQWKVLLIEAGGDEPTPSSVPAWVTAYWFRNDTDWMYFTEPQEHACLAEGGRCYWMRAKMLGGCTVTNGMMYMRGHQADYDGWEAQGAKGWAWKDVFPTFLKSEDNKQIGNIVSPAHHNKGGPIPVQQFNYAPTFAHDLVSSGIELGYRPTTDLNGDVHTGIAIAQTMNHNGSRYSSARAFLRPAAYRPNLHVLLDAHVSRVIVNPASKKVERVEYIKNGETKTVDVKKEAILSAGAINTPQILLLSGIGPKETLEKFNIPAVRELPGVGQNLHNHVGVNLEFTLTKEADIDELNWEAAMMYMLKREGPLSSTGMSQLTAIMNSRYAPEGGHHPDLQFFFRGYGATCGSEEIQDPEKPDRRTITISVVNTQPKSRGYVSLRSVDPLQAPVMQPNYFIDKRDLDVVVDGAKMAYTLINATILKLKYGMIPKEGYASECGENTANPTDAYLECVIKRYTAPENHQAGSCKIGAQDDIMAVVDPELKVYGIEGLRVADASVMPTVVTANTAAPTIMIGERAAEFITARYQRSKNDLGNRFGEDSDGNYASHEASGGGGGDGSGGGNKFGFGGYSDEAKDDKLTQTPSWHGQAWKPWDKTWHQWDKPYFQHNSDWHAKDQPSQRYYSSR